MQLVAPSAVKIAVATDAMICTIHFNDSFFVIIIPSYRLLVLWSVASGRNSASVIVTALVLVTRGTTTILVLTALGT